MPMYEYRCPNNHLIDRVCGYDERMNEQKCATCGELAVYVISAPKLRYLSMGVDCTMTTAADKWADMHIHKTKQEAS